MEIIVNPKLKDLLTFKPFYLVGGYVRDYIIKRESKDVDIAYHGDIKSLYSELINKFGNELTNLKLFEEYLSISFKYKDTNFTITATRKEVYSPHFACTPCTIFEDLARRDFTMNAIAYDIKNKKIIDPFNGIEDIQNKTVKRVANFLDDPSRIIRAIRFKYILNFDIESETKKEMLANLSKISTNFRVQKELISLINS